MNPEYWFLYRGQKEAPEAWVRVIASKTRVLAGNRDLAKAFKLGRPDTIKYPAVAFQFLGHKPDLLPADFVAAQKLSKPKSNSAERLRRSRLRQELIRNAGRLDEDSIEHIKQLKQKGVKHKFIADKYRVSVSFIKRLKDLPNPQFDVTHRGAGSSSPQATEYGGSR